MQAKQFKPLIVAFVVLTSTATGRPPTRSVGLGNTASDSKRQKFCCDSDKSCQSADTPDSPLSPVEQLLDRLEKRGKELKSLQADFIYRRTQGLLGDVQVRLGALAHARQPKSRFAVRFTRRVVNQALRDDKQHFIFDGSWLVEKTFANKMFIKRQVVAPGQTFDPLAIGQGPFPMPLGQKRKQVLKLFNVEKIDPAKDLEESDAAKLPEKCIRLKLIPKVDPKTGKPAVEFERVDLWYDAQTLLPVMVRTADESENQTDVILRNIVVDKLDKKAAAEWFDTATPKPGSGWRVQIKPWDKGDTPTAPNSSPESK